MIALSQPDGQGPPVRHLAIIMDGNGRWAKKQGLPRSAGHQAGADTAQAIVTSCRKMNIPVLTLYAFSRENWTRPKEEVQFLFDLLIRFLRREQKKLVDNSIRLNVIGNWQELSLPLRTAIRQTMDKTARCDQMILNLALNYSGRDEILHACRSLLAQGIAPEEVTEEVFQSQLYTGNQPDPDLILRTSGELRLSNYLIFQSAYSEFSFTKTLWPDFTEKELYQALEDFRRRNRRFGGVEEA
ncbi:MAG: polyprenyl diphosphate synthase [Desulfovermiculus sp.]|nr:polyprenyl diphosphate synthase [Desulfovermiculus sp.]